MNTQILDCGHTNTNTNSLSGGYGKDEQGLTHCYDCCAAMDLAYMHEHGKITLYLDTNTRTISNWPGSLKFKTGPIRKARHNIARCQYTAYFTDFAGHTWIARMYGDDTMIAHCKRLKS